MLHSQKIQFSSFLLNLENFILASFIKSLKLRNSEQFAIIIQQPLSLQNLVDNCMATYTTPLKTDQPLCTQH